MGETLNVAKIILLIASMNSVVKSVPQNCSKMVVNFTVCVSQTDCVAP